MGAAVAVAVVVIALVLLTHRSDPGPKAAASRTTASTSTPRATRPPAPPPIAALPSPVGNLLPGSTVLGEYSGAGPSTVHPGRPAVRLGHQLTITALCEGVGTAQVGPVAVPSCAGVPVGAVVDAGALSAVHIAAPDGTRWRFAVVDEPDHGTNGALEYPASEALQSLHAPGVVGARSGHGSATISLARNGGEPAQDLRLIITCDGAGVSFSSAGGEFDGMYTHTCFTGWSYEFDASQVELPDALHVVARATTSWHVVVVAS
jgi:hypothetical protein